MMTVVDERQVEEQWRGGGGVVVGKNISRIVGSDIIHGIMLRSGGFKLSFLDCR